MVERVLDAVFPHDGVVLGGGRGAAAGHLAAALLAAAQHADQPLLGRKLENSVCNTFSKDMLHLLVNLKSFYINPMKKQIVIGSVEVMEVKVKPQLSPLATHLSVGIKVVPEP